MIIKHALSLPRLGSLLAGLFLQFALSPAFAAAQPILVLGDSISAAYGMSLEQGWVALMAKELDKTHPNLPVVNASISGETSSGALARLPTLLAQHQPSLVIIELGGNDGLRGYPLTQLRSNLRQLTTLSQQSGAKVILVPMEIPPNYGSRYTAGFRDSFRIVATETDSALATFLLADIATDPKLMQADGIHPTPSAQALIVANFLPTLLEQLP